MPFGKHRIAIICAAFSTIPGTLTNSRLRALFVTDGKVIFHFIRMKFKFKKAAGFIRDVWFFHLESKGRLICRRGVFFPPNRVMRVTDCVFFSAFGVIEA